MKGNCELKFVDRKEALAMLEKVNDYLKKTYHCDRALQSRINIINDLISQGYLATIQNDYEVMGYSIIFYTPIDTNKQYMIKIGYNEINKIKLSKTLKKLFIKKNRIEMSLLKRLKKELITNSYWSKRERYRIVHEKLALPNPASKRKTNETRKERKRG